ncbi:MAG: SLC13 family permease [Peptococcaceae bacterium]|nr:SLC13 family permease [Peptococcaceae bacterium]
MSTDTGAKMSTSKKVQWIISIVVPVILWVIPTNDVYTRELRWFCVWTCWMLLVVAFDLMTSFIPAFLMPVMYYITGVAPAAVCFSGWTSTIVFVIVGAFVLAEALTDCGLLKRIATWVIIRTGGTINGSIWGCFVVGIIISLITFSNGYVVMAAFTYGVIRSLDVELRSKESAVLIMASAAGVLSSRFFVYAPSVILMLQGGAGAVVPGYEIVWYRFLLHNLPTALYLIIFVFLLTKIYKTNKNDAVNCKEHFIKQYEDMGPVSTAEKKAAFLLLMLLALLVSAPFTGLGTDIGFLIIPMLMFFPGLKVADESCIKRVDMGMIFFIVACVGIGSVGGTLGVGEIISNLISPMLEGKSPTVALLSLLIFGTIANFALTPTAMLTALSGPIAAIAKNIGLNIDAAMYALAHSTDLIFLPYEFIPYLIFFSFGAISMGDFIKISSLRVGLFFVFYVVVLIPFWYLVGVL